ncbi:MAG TPA: hypothetical protein VE442_10645 [Jatrophihabitans sp.]|nr:hypothetical protein [Jatrophihabitans sp.]
MTISYEPYEPLPPTQPPPVLIPPPATAPDKPPSLVGSLLCVLGLGMALIGLFGLPLSGMARRKSRLFAMSDSSTSADS